MVSEIILGLIILALILDRVFFLKKFDDLTNKLMSRNYMEYVRANTIDTTVKTELEQAKKESLPPDVERFP